MFKALQGTHKSHMMETSPPQCRPLQFTITALWSHPPTPPLEGTRGTPLRAGSRGFSGPPQGGRAAGSSIGTMTKGGRSVK